MPFKDKEKQRGYVRKYQARNREKLKELKELQEIEAQAIKIMCDNLVGRKLFSIKQLPNNDVLREKFKGKVSSLPIISADISLPVTPAKIEEATLKIVKDEDTLLLTGEHKGWPCLGIEGLATAKGRSMIKSCGDFERDLLEATRRVQECGHQSPYDVVVNDETKCSDIPLKLPMGIQYIRHSPCLFARNGKQDNMLAVKPSETNFVLVMGADLTVCWMKDIGYRLWECLAPAICEATAICEIQGVQTI
jgi:uncharacterized linocin/CFP29 family protein